MAPSAWRQPRGGAVNGAPEAHPWARVARNDVGGTISC
jgi:hypothetical protein